MANLSGFDASTVEPNKAFDVLPAGHYEAVIIGSEMKPTKDGNGQYLKLELQIISGEFQNRKLFDNLNLQSHGPNKVVTEQIAKGTLSAICRAVNVLTPQDSAELHMKPLRIKLSVETRSDNGEKQSRVKEYSPRTVSAPAPVSNMQTALEAKTPW